MTARLLEPLLGCVVAGGRSSRMGRDKASIVLAGESFLERARRALSGVCASVVISGTNVDGGGELTVVPDLQRDRGPLGGMVSVLRFAERKGMQWVMFLPVDMPLLPTTLLPALLARWSAAAEEGTRICCAETDGILQPLLSLLHVRTARALEERLERGDLRVRPGLQAAAEQIAREDASLATAIERTPVEGDGPDRMLPVGWRPTAAEWALRPHWFLNANAPEDLAVVERALRGSRAPAMSE